jgi:hypothetical protein
MMHQSYLSACHYCDQIISSAAPFFEDDAVCAICEAEIEAAGHTVAAEEADDAERDRVAASLLAQVFGR